MVSHNFSWKHVVKRSIAKYKYRISRLEKSGNGKATMAEKAILKELEEKQRKGIGKS